MSHATNEVLKKKTIWAPLAASIPLNDVSKPQDSVPGETDWIYGQCQKPLVASCFGVCVYVYIQYIGICIDIYIYIHGFNTESDHHSMLLEKHINLT